jgi:hypothetical protein
VTVKLSLLMFGLAVAGSAQDVRGMIDIHVHSAPDVIPRSIDALDAARAAKERGLRAIVLKNHYEPTASLAFFARKQNPGLEVFGGIALNRAVGGVNPAAVERMARLPGAFGRVVWMPTFDAENQVRKSGEARPWVAVTKDGRPLPEVLEVLELIAKYKLVLATGHSTPAETLEIMRAAKVRGVQRIIVTHPILSPIRMSVEEMKQAAELGGYLEFVYNGLIGSNKESSFEAYAKAIRTVTPGRCILASDLGQAANPLPVVGMASFVAGIREQGFTAAEIQQMTVENPSALLGLR